MFSARAPSAFACIISGVRAIDATAKTDFLPLMDMDSWSSIGVYAGMNSTSSTIDSNASSDDADGIPPWEMNEFDKVWLQAGWIIQVVLTVGLARIAFVYWPYKRATPAPFDGVNPACDSVSEFLYETLWGENELSSCANALVILVALLNLVMFSLETEVLYTGEDAKLVFAETSLSWVTDANWWVQIFSMSFVIIMILLRMKGAQAHPKLQIYGGRASIYWFMGSVFAHIEILAILPSFIDLVTNSDKLANLIWIISVRSISWVERQPSTGKAIRQFRHMMKVEGPLLMNMFIFALILWVLLSGLYFIANYDNPLMRWEAANPPGEDDGWQRFESIPSSMFFVLINLLKENPLADKHESLWSRVLVMSVCFGAVPLFAMPAGVLGSTLQRYVLDAEEEGGVVKQGAEMVELRGGPALASASDPNVRERRWDDHNSDCQVDGTAELPETTTTCWQRFEFSLPMFILTCTLSFGSVFVYFLHTASGDEHKKNEDYRYFGVSIFVDAWLWAWVDGVVAGFFALGWFMRVPCRGVCYLLSFDGIIDLLSWVPGSIHFLLWILGSMPTDGGGKRILNALCVFRLLKPERHCGAFRDMLSILSEHAPILKATFFMTLGLWLGFSTVLYYTERDSTDEEMRENYGAMARSMWAEAINLHGEWVWCDYSAVGKGVCTLIGLFSTGLFMVPIAVFSDGFKDKLGNMDDVDFDVQPWQGDARPANEGVRQKVYDLLFCHLHLESTKKIMQERRSLRHDALDAQSSFPGSGDSAISPQKMIDELVLKSTQDAVMKEQPNWGFFPPRKVKRSWALKELTLEFQLFRGASVFMTLVMVATTIALTTDYFLREECRANKTCKVWDVALYGADALAAMFFTVEFGLRVIALSWKHFVSFVGVCDLLSLAMLWITMTTLRSTVFHAEYDSTFYCDDLAVPLRLLRLFCLESYFHAFHVFTRVLWINRASLGRAGYALSVIWYMFGTVLYLFEHDPDAAKANAAKMELDDEVDMIMAQRYPDVLTGLQYALVHLTGDYPITEYSSKSQIAHIFAIVFGMCTMAAFTGVFVAGYTTYYKSERIVERRREAERRLQVIIFTVLSCQRKWRQIVQKRIARRIAEAAGVDMPRAMILTDAEASRHTNVRQAQLKSALQGIFLKNTPEGARIMLVFQAALVINVIATVISTMPEVQASETFVRVLDFVQFFTGYMFLAEYSIHLFAAQRKRKKFFEVFRLLDLFCLIPTFWRLWFVGHPHRWQKKHHTLLRVIDLALIFRVVRVLDFPYVRRTRKRIAKSIQTAINGLIPAAVLALSIWIFTTSLFSWCEQKYDGPEAESMKEMPDALYWTSIFIIGEWANVDFSTGAGSRMCIFYCLFGVATFAVPVGLMMEAVESTIVLAAEQEKQLQILLTKSRSSASIAMSSKHNE